MEINDLREFVVLAQTGNFLEAAEILYTSQSTLSKHIKRMEADLGLPLFERTTRRVKISKYGQLLLPYARQIVSLQSSYTLALQNSLEAECEVLTLGSIPSLAQYNITDVLVEFRQTRPQSTLNLVQTGLSDLREMLRQKKCELAFLREANQPEDDFVKIPYATDTLVAVLPSGHVLAGQGMIPLHLLAGEDFLLIEKQTELYRLSVAACQQSGFEPNVAHTDHKPENLVDLVIKGMGVALLMKRLALYLASPKISIVDLTLRVSSQVNLCYRKDVELSGAARHFVHCAEVQRDRLNLLNL